MSSNIGCLPFDLIHAIAILLDIRSYVNLARINKNLYKLLKDENTARQCLERNVPYHRKVIEITEQSDPCSARKTLSLLYDQKEAVTTSSPYSTSTIAFGTQFLFSQGILCYSHNDQIRILDVFRRSRAEVVVSGRVLNSRITSELGIPHLADNPLQHTTLLNYANNILVFLCEETEGQGAWLLALDISNDDGVTSTIGSCRRLRLRRRLLSKTKLFVRHNRDFLYYGTHSAQREDGHHEWHIQGCNLATGRPVSPKALRLNEFVGSEVGSTACFDIHNGHFYALSNQTSFDTEEVDWTSCYHFISFKVDDASPDLKLRKIWRRQHHEGPINDAWTNLSLQLDELNNQINIIEVRKEWLGGGSLCSRTSYTTSFTESSDEDLALDRPNFPSNDQLSRTLDEHSKPSWLEKPPIRIPKNCHQEHLSDSQPRHEFIRAKTKYHNYSSSAQSFIDLVTDETRIPNSFRSKDRLRLRVASRVPASPLMTDGLNHMHLRFRPHLNDHNDCPIPNSEESFSDTSITLWPADDAPSELFDLLCPGGRVGSMHAVSDDRSLIYLTGAPNAQHNNQKAIVMISFDPGWRTQGLKILHAGRPAQPSRDVQLDIRGHVPVSISQPGAPLDAPHNVHGGTPAAKKGDPKRILEDEIEVESSGTAIKRPRYNATAAESGASTLHPLIWTEPAMYLTINQGFWLR